MSSRIGRDPEPAVQRNGSDLLVSHQRWTALTFGPDVDRDVGYGDTCPERFTRPELALKGKTSKVKGMGILF